MGLVFPIATFPLDPRPRAPLRALRAGLRPAGRLVAQCGGRGNVAEHTAAVASRPEFAPPHFGGMTVMWNFACPEEAEARCAPPGFAAARCWLEPKPVAPADPLRFTMTVTMGPHLARLPEELRLPFAKAVLAESPRPLTLDYVRLNIEARTPQSSTGSAASAS